MADIEAVAAWRALAEERAGVDLAPEQAAAATRAATRARILGKGDTWTAQAVAYEREMGAASPKDDPTETTKRWLVARYSGIAGGGR